MRLPLSQKEAGAYYTPDPVVSSLISWAVRSEDDRLLDPSCGDGGFIAAHRNSVGIEQDLQAHPHRHGTRAVGAGSRGFSHSRTRVLTRALSRVALPIASLNPSSAVHSTLNDSMISAFLASSAALGICEKVSITTS